MGAQSLCHQGILALEKNKRKKLEKHISEFSDVIKNTVSRRQKAASKKECTQKKYDERMRLVESYLPECEGNVTKATELAAEYLKTSINELVSEDDLRNNYYTRKKKAKEDVERELEQARREKWIAARMSKLLQSD